ncbi:hypothetical protein ACFQ3Z_08710 [Streptomyces nogalater]
MGEAGVRVPAAADADRNTTRSPRDDLQELYEIGRPRLSGASSTPGSRSSGPVMGRTGRNAGPERDERTYQLTTRQHVVGGGQRMARPGAARRGGVRRLRPGRSPRCAWCRPRPTPTAAAAPGATPH